MISRSTIWSCWSINALELCRLAFFLPIARHLIEQSVWWQQKKRTNKIWCEASTEANIHISTWYTLPVNSFALKSLHHFNKLRRTLNSGMLKSSDLFTIIERMRISNELTTDAYLNECERVFKRFLLWNVNDVVANQFHDISCLVNPNTVDSSANAYQLQNTQPNNRPTLL